MKHAFLLFLCFAIPFVAVLVVNAEFSPPQSQQQKSVMLLLMVKNEEAVLQRLLSSAFPVANNLFLCDTGSTDETLRVAEENWGGSGLLHVHRTKSGFVNFEESRNECNKAAHNLIRRTWTHVEWVLLMDADFTLVERHGNAPVHDVNMIQIHAGTQGHPHNALHMLIRASTFAKCRYRLWTHEYLDCSLASPVSYGHYDGIYLVDHADGKSRPEKLTRDIALLERWLREVNETDLRGRALYYLARAHEDSGELDKALETYKEHNTGGAQLFTNYLFYAKYRVALILLKQNASTKEIEAAFLDAHQEYDGYFRREPLYYLARLWRMQGNYPRCILYATAGQYAPAIKHERVPLFLETVIYDWALQEELGFCLLKQGALQEAKWHFQQILKEHAGKMDAESRRRIEEELKFTVSKSQI